MIEDIDLTIEQLKKLRKTLDDLTIQSMMFDMDIDIETLTLTEQRKDNKEQWLKNWQAKQEQFDNDPASPEQAWA